MDPDPTSSKDTDGGRRTQRLGEFDGSISALVDEVRAHARRLLANEHAPDVLQTTALVNEAYLFCRARRENEEDSGGLAGEATVKEFVWTMQRILVEHARRRRTRRRGDNLSRVELDDSMVVFEAERTDEFGVIELDAVLRSFAASAPLESEIIRLSFFGGLSATAIGEVLQADIGPVGAAPNSLRDRVTYLRRGAIAWIRAEIDRP